VVIPNQIAAVMVSIMALSRPGRRSPCSSVTGIPCWRRGQDLPLRDSRGGSPLALRPPDDPAVPDEHREQLARLEWATRRPNIELGILPMSPVAVWRSTGFVIYDEVEDGDPLVHIEWLTRPYNESEPEAVETCRRAFTNLLSASVTGNDARRLIGAAAHDLQTGDD
jgi:hypothetical protein